MNINKQFLTALLAFFTTAAIIQAADIFTPYQKSDLRLPSVPLFVNDPYFSYWSPFDKLNDGTTRHWSDAEKAMDGILRVDGKSYRFMGSGRKNLLKAIAAMAGVDGGWTAKVSYDSQSNSDWTSPSFNDASWKTETAAWGTAGEYPYCRNNWSAQNSDIYVRRVVNLTEADLQKDLWVQFSHDDVFELYINGQRIVKTGETWLQGEQHQLSSSQKAILKVGENLIAAHCHNTNGGAYIDFGLFENVLVQNEAIVKATQKSVSVMATSTYYTFSCGPVELDLVFTAPMLMDDLDLISTPVNYLSYQVRSTDGNSHNVQFYFSTTPQMVVNEMGQPTESSIITENGLEYIKSGSKDQKVLGRTGDLITIDWGYLYLPAINGEVSIADAAVMEDHFVTTGKLSGYQGTMSSTDHASMPTLAFMKDLGNIRQAANFMLIGYDEVKDIRYMGVDYPGYWARNGKTIFTAIEEMRDNYQSIMERCQKQDQTIYDDGLKAGNKKYAELLAGSYRHVMAAHKLFQDSKGNILYFSKENNSNGCVNTVDLTYPEAPLYLMYNTTLMKGMIRSILDYCSNQYVGHYWGFKDFAAHDLGTYPHANGQVYAQTSGTKTDFGGNMPIEESGNILTLIAAIAHIEGNTDWLTQTDLNMLYSWAVYLRDYGQDPDTQLCTDDFAGHWAHNANLSLKAIFGVVAYAYIAEKSGKVLERRWKPLLEKARQMAQCWEVDARDGNHYKLAFDRGGTWSIKYNLIWDKLWGTHLFSKDVARREIKYYLTKQNTYGLPLDSREAYSKSDWIMWAAAMSPDTETFLRFSDKIWKYANETPTRWPLSDWFWTNGNGSARGFRARSVIGGHWMKVLMDKYAPAEDTAQEWKPAEGGLTTPFTASVNPDCPLPEYPRPQFERSEWLNLNGLWDYAVTATSASQPSEFDGKILVPYPIESSLSGVRRQLDADEALWYKREFTIPAGWAGKNILLNFGAVDYNAAVYLNGRRIGSHTGGYTSFSFDITEALKEGVNTLAVKVLDPTDISKQPVGKQRINSESTTIWYTPCSGIWQTVWLEPVSAQNIYDLRIIPNVDDSRFDITLTLNRPSESDKVVVTLKEGQDIVAQQTIAAAGNISCSLDVANKKLWSPSAPFLYNLEVTLANKDNNLLDHVKSYAALRKISYNKDENDYWRLMLNNDPLFQLGTLDQGYWPDGIYTAPTDKALAYDIEKTKEWGFNMIRKHMKVEPARWYYHCDRLGMMVWQDMPSTFGAGEGNWIQREWSNINGIQPTDVERNFKNEWQDIIGQHFNNPCIVVWTPFNECWGQFKTAEIVNFTRDKDNTRLINAASGGNHHKGAGDILDLHCYVDPTIDFNDPDRPLVLGEYGGLGLNIEGHRWYEKFATTYNDNGSVKGVTDRYIHYADIITNLAKGVTYNGAKACFSAAVYTQTTDVETEVNGLMTYDRKELKIEEDRVREANKKIIQANSGTVGIRESHVPASPANDTLYNSLGMQTDTPVLGLNILRKSDGSIVKFMNK